MNNLSNFNILLEFGIVNLNKKSNQNLWIPDEKSSNCYNCLSNFNIFNRRHHCRICGNIFCSNCLNKNIDIILKNSEHQSIKVCEKCRNEYEIFIQQIKENLSIEENIYYKNKNDFNNKKNFFIETKITSYINSLPLIRNEYNLNNFLCIKDEFYEENYIKSINNSYGKLLKILIRESLSMNFDINIVNKWSDILFNLVYASINLIKPSFQYINDTLDITKYITVKTILYKDNSLCQLINGCAINSKLINKKEIYKINYPKILIINYINDNNHNMNINNATVNSFKYKLLSFINEKNKLS